MKRLRLLLLFAALGPLVWGARAGEVRLFAAASLTDALQAAAAGYEKKSGDHLAFNFAASSMLARQIMEGAPADLFFSADQEWMDALEKKGLIAAGTRTAPLGNTLAIIVARESGAAVASPGDLARAGVRRIALADPRSVPAGLYAEAYLKKLGLWEAVRGKVVPTLNVRGALAAVESGDVEAAVVYKTDALISRKVKVAFEVPRLEGPEIRYSLALLKEAPHPEAGRRLLGFLSSVEAATVFRQFGFLVLEKPKP